jgi:hypothetical protein
MYDVTDGGRQFRTYNSVNLAMWHNYKWASMKIWSKFAKSIWAPLWHHLYPACAFYEKPGSLPNVTTHLLYACMAAETIRPLIEEAKTRDLNASNRTMLTDLAFVLDVAIPVVLHTHILEYTCENYSIIYTYPYLGPGLRDCVESWRRYLANGGTISPVARPSTDEQEE